MAQMQNPFLLQQFLQPGLLEDLAPQARNPATPTPTPTPTPAPVPQPEADVQDPQFESRRQRWQSYLKDPRVQAGLWQFGVAMMTPGVGLGQAVGAGIGAAGRVPQMQRDLAQQQAQAQRQEQELELDKRRVGAYERSIDVQERAAAGGGLKPGELSDVQRYMLNKEDKAESDFMKNIRDRAESEYESALEAYNNQLLMGTSDQPPPPAPDYNKIYNRVSTEEILRQRGLWSAFASLPPEDQQAFVQLAERQGPQDAIAVLLRILELRKQQTETTPGNQTPEATPAGT